MAKRRASIMVLRNSDGHALIQHRTATAPWMPLCWDLPGGLVDGDETHEAAAIRETIEECGLTPTEVRELANVAENLWAFHGYVVGVAIPIATPNVDGILEHDDFRWVSRETLHLYNIVEPSLVALGLVL